MIIGIQEISIHFFKEERGTVLILTFIVLVSLSGLALAFLTLGSDEIKGVGAGLQNIQAFYIAEAGLAKARWALTTGGEDVGWAEADRSFGEGTYDVTTVDNGDSTYTITSDGYIPNDTNPIAKRRVIERNIPATTQSGTNLSLAVTASASSVQGSNTADNANDGNSHSNWRSAVNNGSWLKLDFGSATSFDNVVLDGKKIKSYMIEYSTDDVTYQEVTNLVESPAWTFVFDSVWAQYLRFSVNGNKPEINEIETYNTATASTTLGRGTFVTSW